MISETGQCAIAGYPGVIDSPFSWESIEREFTNVAVFADLVEFLERIGTHRTTDVVFQSQRGMVNALKICHLLKQHTGAAIHLVCEGASEEEINQAHSMGIVSVHDVSLGYGALIGVLRESQTRRTVNKTAVDLVVGTIRIDTGRRKVFVGSTEMATTKTEFEILRALGQHPGEIVTRQELIEHVWGAQWYGAPNVLDTHITHLRAKLLQAGCGTPVTTVRGVGFYIDPPMTPTVATFGDQAIA